MSINKLLDKEDVIYIDIFIDKEYNKGDTDVYNSLSDSEGEVEGGMIWENGIETCIISYMK